MASLFSRQRNPNMEKALFDWPIVLQYDVKEISRKFFGHEVCLPARSLSQPKPRCVCIRFIHQSNRSISVCLLFLFCSRVFISRSYENRSIMACLHGVGGPQIGEVTCGASPHLLCERDHIN